jgi:hypothetical protein
MSSIRLFVFAALASGFMVACGAPVPKPDGGTGGGGGGCFEDVDCPDPRFFFCNTTTSQCEPSCKVRNDCTADARGQYALDECAGGLGCQCDEGKCVAGLCGSDAD